MITSFITDNEIDLTPVIRNARANKELMLRYNYDSSERNLKNRRLRREKQSGKNTKANKHFIYKNNNIK